MLSQFQIIHIEFNIHLGNNDTTEQQVEQYPEGSCSSSSTVTVRPLTPTILSSDSFNKTGTLQLICSLPQLPHLLYVSISVVYCLTAIFRIKILFP